MDAFIVDKIVNESGLMEWRKLINRLNNEYHREFCYEKTANSPIECLRCKNCREILWNWRNERGDYSGGRFEIGLYSRHYHICQLRKIIDGSNCYDVIYPSELPKNY